MSEVDSAGVSELGASEAGVSEIEGDDGLGMREAEGTGGGGICGIGGIAGFETALSIGGVGGTCATGCCRIGGVFMES